MFRLGPCESTLTVGGRVMLIFPNAQSLGFLTLRWKLQVTHHFHRRGRPVGVPYYEIIGSDYVRGSIKLHTGWEGSLGLYVVSDNPEGDEFLKSRMESNPKKTSN